MCVGFPVGGDTISVTSGVVSRVEVMTYAAACSELLGIQIDAAINSGNSGGGWVPEILTPNIWGVEPKIRGGWKPPKSCHFNGVWNHDFHHPFWGDIYPLFLVQHPYNPGEKVHCSICPPKWENTTYTDLIVGMRFQQKFPGEKVWFQSFSPTLLFHRSTGPAFNAFGECLGMAFQSLSSESAENIGYVIPTVPNFHKNFHWRFYVCFAFLFFFRVGIFFDGEMCLEFSISF